MQTMTNILMTAAALAVLIALGLSSPDSGGANANPMKANHAQYERMTTNYYVDGK